MNVADWQTLVTMALVALAFVFLLRRWVRRWRPVMPVGQADALPDAKADGAARPAACASCRACSSGGCH